MVMRRRGSDFSAAPEAAALALDALRAQPARTALAILGVVTVVVVASSLVGLRNSIALLFRELGSDNLFAYHLNGDPYSAPTDTDVARPQFRPEDGAQLARLGDARFAMSRSN